MDYIEEFHKLQSRTDLRESEEQSMARFINGLKSQLRESNFTISCLSVKTIIMVEQLEKQSNKYSNYYPRASTSKFRTTSDKSLVPPPSEKLDTWEEKRVASAEVEKLRY